MRTVAEWGTHNAIAALASWWSLAGVDSLVRDTPESWLLSGAPADEPPAAGEVPAATKPAARKSARAVAPAEDFGGIATLTELEALVRGQNPRAPFSDGVAASGVMLVGAGPAADDFTTGRPFSGPAGRLLDNMLRAIGLDRTSCYIALAAPRWGRPTPPPAEAYVADAALIAAQVRLAAPRLLLLLGAGAAESLAGETTPIGKLRGQWLAAGGIPALATYNPGYLLRRPEDKALVWADLLAFKRRLLQ